MKNKMIEIEKKKNLLKEFLSNHLRFFFLLNLRLITYIYKIMYSSTATTTITTKNVIFFHSY